MAYTKVGPFVDGGAPYLSAANMNILEAGIIAGNAGVTVAPAATGVAATDTANLQAAITSAQNAFQDLYIPGSQQSYVLNAGLTWNLAKGSLIGVGQASISGAGISSGPTLTVTSNNGVTTSGVYTHGAIQHRVAGLNFFGPDTDAGTVDGIYFTDTANGDNGSLEHVRLYGFRDGVSYGNNAWLINHYKVSIEHSHRYGINGTMGTNAGEEMHFTGCVISGSSNAGGTAVGFYTPGSGAYSDWTFTGCSFDYNNLEADINGHFVSFIGCHIEDLNTGPMVTTSATGGQDLTQVNFVASYLADTNTATGGRTVLVTTKASSASDNVTINFASGKSGKYDTAATLYQNLSTALPTVTIGAGWNHDVGGATYVPQYGTFLSALGDGGFESNTAVSTGFGGWSLDANSGFYTTVAHSGTYSLRRTGVGTAYQIAPITRRPVSISGYVNCNNYTSGSSTFQVQFLAPDRTTVLSTVVLATVTATSSWTGVSRRLMPPAGAAYVSVQSTASTFVGTWELDDVQLINL